jgi:broad specificity phosphatase PhoE
MPRAVANPTRVLLVRHGQSTWNAAGRWQGQEDPPLTDMGERQAKEAAQRLAALQGSEPIDAVWASDLQRAATTARAFADAFGVDVRTDTRFRERHAGPWQGCTRAEIEERWPGFLGSSRRPDGYEPDADLVARTIDALDDLSATHPGERVVVVTHGGVLRQLEVWLGDHERGLIPNLSGRWFVRTGDGPDASGWSLGDAVLLVGEDSVTVPKQI